MKKQSYSNHIRFYTPHHFVYYPIVLLFIGASLYLAIKSTETILWIFMTVAFVFLFCLAFMLRQHYALTLQNRIVKLELRYRYFALTGKRFEIIENQLTEAQIFALRFAPDEELIILIQKTIAEDLTGDEIKKNIINWKPDHQRV